ncbi:MAG TPA: aldo/keto reductase [Burkholderiaceae bacterium]
MNLDPATNSTQAPDGLHLSSIVAGAWRMAEWGFTPQQRLAWIRQCVDLGVTSFDHADIYGGYTAEGLFGEALALDRSVVGRIQLVSKCGIKLVAPSRPEHAIKSYDTSKQHIIRSAENSLRSLGVERLDLLLIHRPDALMDPAIVADAFETLRRAGKVAHFGVSNHSVSQLALLQQYTPLATHQFELSPLQLQALADGTLDQCIALRMRPMIWSPLAGGRLLSGADAAAQRVQAVLAQLAHRYEAAPATLAYAWLLRHPSRPLPISGSSRIEALRAAVAARDVELSAEDWYAIWQAGAGREVP